MGTETSSISNSVFVILAQAGIQTLSYNNHVNSNGHFAALFGSK